MDSLARAFNKQAMLRQLETCKDPEELRAVAVRLFHAWDAAREMLRQKLREDLPTSHLRPSAPVPPSTPPPTPHPSGDQPEAT